MSVVGIDFDKVESIINDLKAEITRLSDTTEEVSNVSKSIEETFGGQAGHAFQLTMADYVTKANDAIPVLESIVQWVEDTRAAYEEYDGQIADKFKLC